MEPGTEEMCGHSAGAPGLCQRHVPPSQEQLLLHGESCHALCQAAKFDTIVRMLVNWSEIVHVEKLGRLCLSPEHSQKRNLTLIGYIRVVQRRLLAVVNDHLVE